MAEIKNIHLVTGLSESDKTKMEHAGVQHRRHSGITFKIVKVEAKKVTIQTVQGRNAHGKYQDRNRLVELTKETFGRFFPGMTILVHAVTFTPSPAADVDAKWVNKRMLETKTDIKTMTAELDIDHTQLRSLITETNPRPLSKPMKALFWYYFLSKVKK